MAKKFVSTAKLMVTRVDVQERTSQRSGTEYDQVVVSFEDNLRIRCFASDQKNFDLLCRLNVGEKMLVEFDRVSVFIPGTTGETTQSGATAIEPQRIANPTPQVTLEGWHIDWDTFEEAQLSEIEKKIMGRDAKEKRKIAPRASTSLLKAVNIEPTASAEDEEGFDPSIEQF